LGINKYRLLRNTLHSSNNCKICITNLNVVHDHRACGVAAYSVCNPWPSETRASWAQISGERTRTAFVVVVTIVASVFQVCIEGFIYVLVQSVREMMSIVEKVEVLNKLESFMIKRTVVPLHFREREYKFRTVLHQVLLFVL
jgi:hypothetical protein